MNLILSLKEILEKAYISIGEFNPIKTPDRLWDHIILSNIMYHAGMHTREVCKNWNKAWWDYLSRKDKLHYGILFKEQKYLYSDRKMIITKEEYLTFINKLLLAELNYYMTKMPLQHVIANDHHCNTCGLNVCNFLQTPDMEPLKGTTNIISFINREFIRNLSYFSFHILSFKHAADPLRYRTTTKPSNSYQIHMQCSYCNPAPFKVRFKINQSRH